MDDQLGPTGRYPFGRDDPTDRGELGVAARIWRGQVRLDFGTSLTWLSIPPDGAREVARVLLRMADEIDEGKRSRR